MYLNEVKKEGNLIGYMVMIIWSF